MRFFYFLGSAALCLAATPLWAQDFDQKPEEIITTGVRAPTKIDDIGNATTVIDAADLERRQVRTLPDAFALTPGVSVTQLGGAGQQTSIFTRGADPNQTLILLDGQPYQDPSSPSGAFDISQLTVGDIDRIEIVRGAQSAVYGSQAGAGVINIITKRPGDEPHASAFVEGGSFNTLNERAQFSDKIGGVGIQAVVDHLDTGGEDVTPPQFRAGVPGVNYPYNNTSGALTLTGDLTDNLKAKFFGQAIEGKLATAPTPEDPNSFETNHRYYTSLGIDGDFFDQVWKPALTVSYTHTSRHDENAPDALSSTTASTINEGLQNALVFVNDITVSDADRVIVGLDATRNTLSASGSSNFGGFVIANNSSAQDHNVGVYVEDVLDTERLGGTVGFRFDTPENYSTHGTYHIAPMLKIDETGTRIKASVGSGFKTPSLFERFGFNPANDGTAFVGNPNLMPTTSHSWEAGFEQQIFGKDLTMGATYFHVITDNAISTVFDANFNSTTVNNVFEKSRGVETFIEARPIKDVGVRLNYTYDQATDRMTGQPLLRRPKHLASLETSYQATEALRVTGVVRYVGAQQDIGLFGGTVRDRGYLTADLTGAYDLTSYLQFFGRVNNLFDRSYQTANGFAGFHRTAIVGLQGHF